MPGVAEVAPIGGFGKQYQVNVDPNRLQAYGIPITRVVEAVRGGNTDVGGRLIEFGGAGVHGARPRLCALGAGHREHRPLGERERHADPRQGHRPGRLGPDIRRGVSDLDGTGEVGLRASS